VPDANGDRDARRTALVLSHQHTFMGPGLPDADFECKRLPRPASLDEHRELNLQMLDSREHAPTHCARARREPMGRTDKLNRRSASPTARNPLRLPCQYRLGRRHKHLGMYHPTLLEPTRSALYRMIRWRQERGVSLGPMTPLTPPSSDPRPKLSE